MKPLTNSGGLVDFKEKLIFEEYKDKEITSASGLKKDIKDKYGFIPKDIYVKIHNYQIKKYGRVLSKYNSVVQEWDKTFKFKSAFPNARKKCNEYQKAKGKTANLWRYRALSGGFNIFEHEYIMIFQKTKLKKVKNV